MVRLAAITLLVSSVAFAQVPQALVMTWGQSQETQTFNASECNSRALLTWTVNTIGACDQLRLWVSSGSTCADTGPGSTDVSLGSVSLGSTLTGTQEVRFSELPAVTDNDGGLLTCGSATTRTWRVCGMFETPNSFGQCGGSNGVKNRDEITLTYDGKPPGVPTITDAAGADQAIRVRVDVDGDTVGVRFAVRPKDDTTDFVFGDQVPAAGNTEGRIEGLTNYVEYEVKARAVDAAGNESDASETSFATPVRTAGFFETYKAAGGQETGGCAAAPGLFGAAFVVIGIWISRRKKS